MKNHIPNNIEIEHHENKSKVQKMQEKFRSKLNDLHKIEFKIGFRTLAVYLTDTQLLKSQIKAKKANLDIHQYYIKKYSKI